MQVCQRAGNRQSDQERDDARHLSLFLFTMSKKRFYKAGWQRGTGLEDPPERSARRRLTEDHDERKNIVDAFLSGDSITKVSRRFGWSRSAIRNALKREGVL